MKKLFRLWLLLLALSSGFQACDDSNYDELKGDIDNIQGQIDELKAGLQALQDQVNSIQGIVDALEGQKAVTAVEETADGRGYKITFNDASTIEVLKNTNGSALSMMEVDGKYYWAIVTNGTPATLLDADGNPVAVDDAGAALSLDAYGYLTLGGQRVKDANDDFVLFKKGESGAYFKDIAVTDTEITFTLPDDSQVTLSKTTETFLRFDTDKATPFYLLNPGKETRIKIVLSADLKNVEVAQAPEGWTTHVHVPDKYVAVTPPSDASSGVGELRLQAIDKNGLVYQAIARVSTASSGFDDENGIFVLNEGNMTTENGSLVYIDAQGSVLDYAYRSMNGTDLGNVAQDLCIQGGRIYIISQNGKTNAVGTGFDNDGRLVVADSKTLVKQAAYDDELASLSWPSHIAVLDEENVYIRDNKGMHLFNTQTGSLTAIEGSSAAQKKTMAVVQGKVFAAGSREVLVMEKGQATVARTIDMGGTVAAIAKSDDGNLWVSLSGKPSYIAKVDAQTYEVIKKNTVDEVNLSAGSGAGCAIAAHGDKLYYSGLGSKVYRHDFESGTTTLLGDAKDFNSAMKMTYNPIAVHPVTGHIFMNRIAGYGWLFLDNSILEMEDTGSGLQLVKQYEDHTHFPAGIFFPASFKD